MPHKLKYRVLPQALSVCRLAPGAAVPAWATSGEFSCITRTPDETSIVCVEDIIPPGEEGVAVESGWVAFELEGPFPFAMTGVLASFVQPLAKASVPVFAISTFHTDYVLIKRENHKQALTALGEAGHQLISGEM
jgi:uncharacterized protein